MPVAATSAKVQLALHIHACMRSGKDLVIFIEPFIVDGLENRQIQGAVNRQELLDAATASTINERY